MCLSMHTFPKIHLKIPTVICSLEKIYLICDLFFLTEKSCGWLFQPGALCLLVIPTSLQKNIDISGNVFLQSTFFYK